MTIVANETKRKPGKTLQLDIGSDRVAMVTIDVPGERLNTMTVEVLQELEVILEQLETEGEADAVVFVSGKPEGFMAGADVRMLAGIRTAEEGTQLSRVGQQLLNRVEALP